MGAWSKACDCRCTGNVDHDLLAVEHVVQAIGGWRTEWSKSRIVMAGAHLRAWRKSLREESERHEDFDVFYQRRMIEREILWMVLSDIVHARSGLPGNSFYLRRAEAGLRTVWKAMQP